MKVQLEVRSFLTLELPDSYQTPHGPSIWGENAENVMLGAVRVHLERELAEGTLRFYRRLVPEPVSTCLITVQPSTDTGGTAPRSRA